MEYGGAGEEGMGTMGRWGICITGSPFIIISSPAHRADGEMLPLKACSGPVETSQRCPQLDPGGIRSL